MESACMKLSERVEEDVSKLIEEWGALICAEV